MDSAESEAARQQRSLSRGRDLKSTGRGGAGNIYSATGIDQGTYVETLPVRGREASHDSPSRQGIFRSSGRGGAGNFQSPSRDPSQPPSGAMTPSEEDLVRARVAASQIEGHAFGRGGAGNIIQSLAHSEPHSASASPARQSSRSRSRARVLTGRGGAGNLVMGSSHPYENEAAIQEEEAEERAEARERAEQGRGRAAQPAQHSTGRGGAANMSSAPEPPPEPLREASPHAGGGGRGGSGNILHSLTRARAHTRGEIELASPTSASGYGREDGASRADDHGAVGGRAVDSRAESSARSRSRGPGDNGAGRLSRERASDSAERSLWDRLVHPMSPRA